MSLSHSEQVISRKMYSLDNIIHSLYNPDKSGIEFETCPELVENV